MFNQKGLKLLSVLILIFAFGALIAGGFLLLNNERSKTRDAKRLSDITRVQAAFEFLYNDVASYEFAAQDGCSQTGMLVSQCNLSKYLPLIIEMKDPGKNSYIVSKVPSIDEFEVVFQLENSYGSLIAGQHILSQNGIQ